MTTETNIHNIPSCNMDRLNHEIAKLNRRAVKIGVAPLEVVVHGTHFIPCPYAVNKFQRQLTKEELAALPQVEITEVEINGEGPKVQGYKFIGTLDHYSIPGTVLVNAVPGERVPAEFFQAESICHHCDKIRRRTETFIFEKEDGTYMQVGRTCLKDFFGHDPSRIARFLSRIITFVNTMEEEDNFGSYGNSEHCFDPIEVLTLTVAVIRSHGWVARSAVIDESTTATADNVIFLMRPTYNAKEREVQKEFEDTIIHHETDQDEATAALEWLKTQDADSSYVHNLLALSTLPLMPISKLGYWCSVVSAYQREQNRLEIKRQENINKLNEHIGDIKERLELDVECTGIQYIDGMYGTICIHRMLTTDGRTLVWFANTGAKMDKGNKYTIKGTVKKHDVYKDWKQTHLNRVKVVEKKTEEVVAVA